MNRSRPISLTALLAACFALVVCSVSSPPTAQAVVEPQAIETPVIGQLVSNRMAITIHATPTEPVYSATDATGRQIASRQTRNELLDRHPAVHQHVETAVALPLDASVIGVETLY